MTLTKSDIKSRIDKAIIQVIADQDVQKFVLGLMKLSTDIAEEINGPERPREDQGSSPELS